MQTGQSCQSCGLPILTNQVIVGFPIIRIVSLGKSAMTGNEMLFHVECFQEKMKGPKIISLNGAKA
jgi:hypothetical protein